MIDQAVLHGQTARQLQLTLRQPPHALLLHGATGIGKRYVAELLAATLIDAASNEVLQTHPHYLHITTPADKSSIGIEAVRDMLQFTKLRLPASAGQAATIHRIILISDAHTLTTEAQNALLKLLEEPPQHTMFILTAPSPQSLLPTIRSRAQLISVQQPPQDVLVQHFATQTGNTASVRQAYLMSGGLPGLMAALIHNDDHPLKSAVQTARKLLQSSQFERLCLVDDFAKKKPEALQVFFVLQHMSRAAIAQGANLDHGQATKRIQQWHRIMQSAYDAERAYGVSAQAKLALCNLMLAM